MTATVVLQRNTRTAWLRLRSPSPGSRFIKTLNNPEGDS